MLFARFMLALAVVLVMSAAVGVIIGAFFPIDTDRPTDEEPGKGRSW